MEGLISQIQPGVVAGELSEACLEGFLSLYCLQAHGVCGVRRDDVGGASGRFAPGGEVASVCAGDCVQVIAGECGEGGWSYLTNIVRQLRNAGTLTKLPPLMGLDECNQTNGMTSEGERFCLTPTQFQGDKFIFKSHFYYLLMLS